MENMKIWKLSIKISLLRLLHIQKKYQVTHILTGIGIYGFENKENEEITLKHKGILNI